MQIEQLPPPDDSAASDAAIDAVMQAWAAENKVRFVNRSYGEYTTDPLSLATLQHLVRLTISATRQDCADVCNSVPVRVGNDGIWRCEVQAAILGPRPPHPQKG